jgi:hypothetical protein
LEYVRDTIWTLISPLQYGLLVQQRGWPVRRYQEWISTALVALAGKRPAKRRDDSPDLGTAQR